MSLFSYFILLFLGLLAGSFLNVVIYRLPRGGGVIRGRSACPNCGKVLAWHDLMPLLSFLFLKGRCRQCQDKISWRYPLVELFSALIFLAVPYAFTAYGVQDKIFLIFILEIFLALFFTDLTSFILPDSLIIAGVVGALIYKLTTIFLASLPIYNLFSLTNILAGVVFGVFIWLNWLISRGKWIGLGDAKLMFLVGLVFGFWGGLFCFYLGVLIGGAAGLVLLLFKKAGLKSHLPLGAFISLSVFVYVFFGQQIIQKLSLFSIPLILK